MPDAAPTKAVPVQLPDGRMGTVAPGDVASVLDQGGRAVSDQEFSSNQKALNRQEKYSTPQGVVEGLVAPNVAGGLRGLSAGLSDPLLIGGAGLISPEAKEAVRGKLNEYKEEFPISSAQGEIAGIVGPAIAGAGRAPAGLSGLISRGGTAVERAALSGLGGLEGGLARRALVRGASLGAQGAFEGALYGAGHEASEAALGNTELTADKLLAGAKGGALYGFAGGALLGGGGELVSGGLRTAAQRTLAPVNAASKEQGTLAKWLENKAGEMTLRHAGADKALVKNLDKYAPGGHEGVGVLLANEAPQLVGKQSVGQMNRELWAEAAGKGKQLHGAAMENVLEAAQKYSQQAPIKAASVINDIRAVAAPFRDDLAHVGKLGIVRQIDGFADDVARRVGLIDKAGEIINPDVELTLKDIHSIRRAADDLWAGNKINPVAKPIKGVRDAVTQRLSSEVEKAGGPEALQAWKDANQRWQAYHALEKASSNASAKGGANQFLGLTDKIFANAGAGIGYAVAGPIGGLAGGAIAGLGSKAFRSRFDAVAADALLKVSRVGAAKALAGSVDAQIGASVRSFLEGGAVKRAAPGFVAGVRNNLPQGGTAGATSRDEYEQIAEQVGQMRMLQKSGIAPKTGLDKFGEVAPNVTAALANRHANAIDFLGSTMPPARVDPFAMSVPGSMYVPKSLSPAELKWMRSVEAVRDPAGVFRDLAKGRVTFQQVDALKAVYPALYEHLKTTVKEAAIKRGKPLSVEQASAYGILIGEPVHFSQRPEFVLAMQASKVAEPPVNDDQPANPSSRKSDMDPGVKQSQTLSDEIER